MREHEHLWEPFGSAMLTSAKATLDAQGTITDWQFDVWSFSYYWRRGQRDQLAFASLLYSDFGVLKYGVVRPAAIRGAQVEIRMHEITNPNVVCACCQRR